MCWLYIDEWCDDPDEMSVRLLTVLDSCQLHMGAYVGRDGHLILRTADSGVRFDNFTFVKGRWYHVALVHTRPRLKASMVTLFVDGLPLQVADVLGIRMQRTATYRVSCAQTIKHQYITTVAGQDSGDIVCVLGTSLKTNKASSVVWRMGGMYLFDEVCVCVILLFTSVPMDS